MFAFLLISCNKEEEPVVLSNENLITSFSLIIEGEEFEGNIDQQVRIISFDTEGKDISSLKPSMIYSEKARIEPSPDLSQDFRQEVTYKVYAENGAPNVYRIQVNNRPISADNEINSFTIETEGNAIEATIDRQTGIIRADIPFVEIDALSPVISLPDYASIDPPTDEPQDFTVPVSYTVTAENGDIRSYTVQLNEPKIERILHGYSPTPKFYVGAEAGIMGRFLMNDGEYPEFYLFDGTTNYEVEQKEYHFSYEDTHTGVKYYAVNFVIPDDIPTNNYTAVIEKTGYRAEFDHLDIKAENAPDPQSLSQDVFTRDDAFRVIGENLTARIIIPSNGSHYKLWSTSNIDITVNEERTEMTFIPNFRQDNLYPSYYGREPQEKKITFFDEFDRIGRNIKAVFE